MWQNKKFLVFLAIVLVAGAAVVAFFVLRDKQVSSEDTTPVQVASEEPKNPANNPLDPQSRPATPCRRDFGYQFFPPSIVETTLEQNGMNAADSAAVANELKSKITYIHQTVWDRAQKMNPNPFDNADQKIGDALYRTVALEVFVASVKNHGLIDHERATGIFDDVQASRTQKFAECEGYAKQLKVEKGYMPVVRVLTIKELQHDVPEAFNPRFLPTLKEKADQDKANAKKPAPEKK